MSSELERRLERLLAEAPEPDPGAGEEALHRALRALQPAASARRGIRTAVLVFAGTAVLLAIAAGSLSAAGALHVSFGSKEKPLPAVRQLVLPKGASGIAAIVDGRLSVAIKGGFRLQTAATAAALSPHALYIAAGIGHSLVAMAPNGRVAWTHPVRGRVVAIAWRPDGLQIAYLVRRGSRVALHVIYGNDKPGSDRTIDRSVRAIRPSWRADSLALAYVGAGGGAIVYDRFHQRRHLVPVNAPVTGVAFAPQGDALAVETGNGVWLARADGTQTVTTGAVEAFGWLDNRLAVVVPGEASALLRLFTAAGFPRGSSAVRGVALAVTPKLVVVRTAQSLVTGRTTLLSVPRRASVRDLQVG
ncbi:MAG TPA: hypothetical protein VKO84_05505 [Gaiellaceae bacterium]|nr:hypothetical protein [Gaiellaceae bacterium]